MLVLIDVYGDGDVLRLVEDTPELDSLLDEWREQDASYTAGVRAGWLQHIGITAFLQERGVRMLPYRSIAL